MLKDQNSGKWQSFFGGHLKSGQTYKQNAVEELQEELDISVNPQELIPLHVRKSESAKHFAQIYILRWNGDLQDLHFDDGEGEKVVWLSQDQLEKEIKGGWFCNSMDEAVMAYLSG